MSLDRSEVPADGTQLIIRAEREGDEPLISALVRRAYADVGYSDHREHLMIERLRRTDAFIPALSLIAEADGEAAAHVLFTRAYIRSGALRRRTLALAPVSVVPDFQGVGIGTRLVRAGHAAAAALGFGSVVLVGIPNYYRRFGYQPLRDYPIVLPFAAPDANCQILPLLPHALTGLAGTVEYADGWLGPDRAGSEEARYGT